jgi:hypothetical protein
MKRFLIPIAVLAGIGLTGAALPAEAASMNEVPAASHTLGAVPGVMNDLAEPVAIDDGETAYLSIETGTEVQVPTNTSEPIVLSNASKGTIAVELPFSEEAATQEKSGTLHEFDNANGSRTVPLVKTDGSVQITTILDGRGAPTRFEYGFSIGAGRYLDQDGVLIAARESDGTWVAGVAPAWAVDAKGQAVPTHYEVSGSTLVQVVDHLDQSFTYPIVADPYLGQSLISRVDVGTEGGKPRYNVVKTAYGNNVALGSLRPGNYDPLLGATVMRGDGWKEAIAKRPAMNIATVKQQYDCHTVFAPSKNPWNLEAFRSQRANWGINPAQCNW